MFLYITTKGNTTFYNSHPSLRVSKEDPNGHEKLLEKVTTGASNITWTPLGISNFQKC